jgi:hypothetical protein
MLIFSLSIYTNGNKSDKAGLSLTLKVTYQHLYLYEQSRRYTPSEYEHKHVYYFKVY